MESHRRARGRVVIFPEQGVPRHSGTVQECIIHNAWTAPQQASCGVKRCCEGIREQQRQRSGTRASLKGPDQL